MAKDSYKESEIIELNGRLDDVDGELTVIVEQGKDSPAMYINVVDILQSCTGRQISLKLTNERTL